MEDKNKIIYLDGYQIFIKGFIFVETYANNIPTDTKTLNSLNKLLIYPSNPLEWGYDIPAVINRNSLHFDSNGLLPKYLYQVWLYSPKSINDPMGKYEGSQLICNWFGDSMEPSISVQQYIIQKLYKFSWLDKTQNIIPFNPKR